jgi:hypothetical protein
MTGPIKLVAVGSVLNCAKTGHIRLVLPPDRFETNSEYSKRRGGTAKGIIQDIRDQLLTNVMHYLKATVCAPYRQHRGRLGKAYQRIANKYRVQARLAL